MSGTITAEPDQRNQTSMDLLDQWTGTTRPVTPPGFQTSATKPVQPYQWSWNWLCQFSCALVWLHLLHRSGCTGVVVLVWLHWSGSTGPFWVWFLKTRTKFPIGTVGNRQRFYDVHGPYVSGSLRHHLKEDLTRMWDTENLDSPEWKVTTKVELIGQ